MLCDVYIMPLWRFKLGDFRPVAAEKSVARQLGDWGKSPLRAMNHFIARDSVRRIRRAVATENGFSVDWQDEGDLVAERKGCEFQAVRAYARWLESFDGRGHFETPVDGNYYKHPCWKAKGRRIQFNQIVDHECCYGYYLPCRFDEVARVEPRKTDRWTFLRAVGSAPRLLEELGQIGSVLDRASHRHFGDTIVRDEVFRAYRQLTEIAQLSGRHQLPIILSRQGASQRTKADRHRRAIAFWGKSVSHNAP